ncbi:glycosyltransferase family 4 protein [Rhodohalobacter sp. 614A]|uniref:glycosyltransferase family 4 protein n=1 Tax=Rhodohalobacter sp. 614A TaxID=2908649 RepID=UPI001F1D77B5|nr:glycosyltransferase family 4 protein [Rhodohalobacter sp. 614A]
MKILITVPHRRIGGIANYFEVIKKYFRSDVEYIYRGSVKYNNYKIFVFIRLIKDYAIFVQKLFYRENKIILINTSINKNSIIRDLIYVFLSKLFFKRVILFIHGWNEKDEGFLKKNRGLRVSIMKTCNAFLVLSNTFKNKLKCYGFKSPIYITTTVVDDEFAPKEFKFHKTNEKRILFLSRIEKEKGIFELIDAFKLLNKYQNFKLVIAGDGTKYDELRRVVLESCTRNIIIKGHIIGSEKKRVFEDCDIYVFPSYHEGMPTTVLEAMSWGLPIITSPVGGLNDFFVEGKMGYFLENREPKYIAEKILSLLNNQELLESISRYNFYFAKEHFYATKVVDRLENIFKEMQCLH